jgi:hypothetical protein
MGNLVDPPDHARCSAKANRSGQRCRRAAIAGGRVCPSHGGRAPQVKRRAAERVALAQVRSMLGVAEAADPRRVLLAAVKACAALLDGAQAAVAADDADAGDLTQLSSAAVTVARVAKLAVDADVETGLALQAERAGELVANMIRRTVEALALPPETAAAAFRHIRSEVEAQTALPVYGHLTVGQLDQEIARVVQRLDDLDRADSLAGFPGKLARAVTAALGAVDLSDAEQEKALAAVEAFLAADAAEQAEREATRPARVAATQSTVAWWVKPTGNGNGGGWR